MNSKVYKEILLNFIVFVLLQAFSFYQIVLFDYSFTFFYVGFVLFLPRHIDKVYQLGIAFLVGIFIDMFSNTLGIHACATVLVVYIKEYWLKFGFSDGESLRIVNVNTIKMLSLIKYVVPLVFVHHLCLFVVENGGLHILGIVLLKVVLSTLFSSMTIIILAYLLKPGNKKYN